MVFTLLLQEVVVLAAAGAVKAARAAKEEATIKGAKAARGRTTTGKEAGAINGKAAARTDSVADGTSDVRTSQALMPTTLRATQPPLIPLHALIHLMFIFPILLLLLLNSLAITVQYLPVVRMILHAMTVKIKAMNISLRKNNLNIVPATAIIILPVTAIIVTAR